MSFKNDEYIENEYMDFTQKENYEQQQDRFLKKHVNELKRHILSMEEKRENKKSGPVSPQTKKNGKEKTEDLFNQTYSYKYMGQDKSKGELPMYSMSPQHSEKGSKSKKFKNLNLTILTGSKLHLVQKPATSSQPAFAPSKEPAKPKIAARKLEIYQKKPQTQPAHTKRQNRPTKTENNSKSKAYEGNEWGQKRPSVYITSAPLLDLKGLQEDPKDKKDMPLRKFRVVQKAEFHGFATKKEQGGIFVNKPEEFSQCTASRLGNLAGRYHFNKRAFSREGKWGNNSLLERRKSEVFQKIAENAARNERNPNASGFPQTTWSRNSTSRHHIINSPNRTLLPYTNFFASRRSSQIFGNIFPRSSI